jgi:hypothetical protein
VHALIVSGGKTTKGLQHNATAGGALQDTIAHVWLTLERLCFLKKLEDPMSKYHAVLAIFCSCIGVLRVLWWTIAGLRGVHGSPSWGSAL